MTLNFGFGFYPSQGLSGHSLYKMQPRALGVCPAANLQKISKMGDSTESVSNLDLCPLGPIHPPKSPQSPPSPSYSLIEQNTKELQSNERVQILENMVQKLLEQVKHLETQ
jgi:hypothetical protein